MFSDIQTQCKNLLRHLVQQERGGNEINVKNARSIILVCKSGCVPVHGNDSVR
jgi:hypothetical protein